MDSDTEVERTTSIILKTLLISLVFTACESKHSNKTSSQTEASKDGTVVAPDTSNRHQKTIYLTFDDGPNRGTPHVLEAVNEEKIPVTMFLIGLHINGSPGQSATYANILKNPYMEVQNHSYTHAHNHFDKFYKSADAVFNDFMQCADSLHLNSNIARTPGRNIWRIPGISFTDIKKTAAVCDTVHQKGLELVGWDIEWRFNNHLKLLSTDDQIVTQIKNLFEDSAMKTPNHLVLLAHDQTFSDTANLASLKRLFQKLKNTGEYNFEVISKYPGLKAGPAAKNDAAITK